MFAVGQARAAECENSPTGTKLRIEISDPTAAKGLMSASVYPGNPAVFLKKDGAVKVWTVPTQSPVTSMCIWLPGPGTYAVAVYQDINGNHKFDHNIFKGIEPFGFSNNPSIGFSAPSFGAAKFHVAGAETTIRVRLNHK